MTLLQELLDLPNKAPKAFKAGDKFDITNNGLHFTIEVVAADKGPSELQIETMRDGKARKSYTDALELSARLRDCEKFKKVK
jgi:chromosome condensin MukBEF MukE localization factor